MKKTIITTITALGLIFGSMAPALAHGHGGHWGHGHWGGPGWFGGGFWPGVGLGVLGTYLLTQPRPVIAAPVGPGPSSYSASPVSLCAQKYKSFDSSTGLFLSNDGTRKLCPYLK